MATNAARIQIKNKRSPHRLGKLIAARAAPEAEKEGAAVAFPMKESPTIDSSATNQTANRVPEFCRGNNRSIIHANPATINPSGSEFRM
jgi:hypothetical protein